jgi:hypothetical protein
MVKEVVSDEYMSVEHRTQAEWRFAREVADVGLCACLMLL